MNNNLVQEINQMHAELCGGLADPTRLMILYTLSDQPHNVTELCAALQMTQPSISRHLKILRDRGLVLANREGQNVLYSLADRRVIDALDLLRAVMASKLKNQATLVDHI
jgi:DNA-binding transcriptional ArsR family regulator